MTYFNENTIATYTNTKHGSVKLYTEDDDPPQKRLVLITFDENNEPFKNYSYDIVFKCPDDMYDWEEYTKFRERVLMDILLYSRYREQTIVGLCGRAGVPLTLVEELIDSDVLSCFTISRVNLELCEASCK